MDYSPEAEILMKFCLTADAGHPVTVLQKGNMNIVAILLNSLTQTAWKAIRM